MCCALKVDFLKSGHTYTNKPEGLMGANPENVAMWLLYFVLLKMTLNARINVFKLLIQ